MYTNNKTFNYKIEIYTWLCNQPSVKPKTIMYAYIYISILRNDQIEFKSIRHTCILH